MPVSTMSVPVGSAVVKLKDDDRICKHLSNGNVFEDRTRELFESMLDKDKWFLDVGCYSGLYAIAACLLGVPTMGVEPMPVNQKQIRTNMKLNDVSFPLFEGAASDFNGRTRLGYNEKVHLTAGASLDRKSGPGVDVQAQRLDSLPRVWDRPVGLIKIDVERHEPRVIDGARKIIEQHRPNLIVEALDEDLKTAILSRLPDYELVEVVDVRNLILRPVLSRADRIAIVASGPTFSRCDFSKLSPDVYVIAVKGAIDGLKRADAWITVDANNRTRERWMDPVRRRLGAYYYAAVPEDFGQPKARLLWHRPPAEPDIHWLRRMPTMLGLSDDPDTINTGNSAYAALGLAYHMKAKRVGLFGVDGTQDRYGIGLGRPRGSLAHLAGLFASAGKQTRQAGLEVRNGGLLACYQRHRPEEVVEWLNDASF